MTESAKALEFISGEKRVKEVAAHIGWKRAQTQKLLDKLYREGLVTKRWWGGGWYFGPITNASKTVS